MGAQTSWTDEEDDFLRRLAAQRHSSAEIAAELAIVFGSERSRNSICGRCHRLGISLKSDLRLRGSANEARAKQKTRKARPAKAPSEQPASKPAPQEAAKTPRPEKPASAVPALRPPAKQKHNANNIRMKATRHLDERFDEVRAQRLAEVAAFEAKVDQSGGINPGVLFLERGIAECAAPMPGWDSVPVQEKRVCGAPVEWRAVNIGAITVEQPTSWCTGCRKRFTVPSTDRRADFGKLASLDRSVRRAA